VSDKTENIRKPASAKDISDGNVKMRAARKRGNEISKTLGPWSGFRAMQTESGGSASEAEKLRKYRAMSTRIGEDELKQITKWCIDHKRAWGPTLLCELSRIPEKVDRERIAKNAIEKRLGLVDLKRMVRLEIGPLGDIDSEKPRVGRKRKLDWKVAANIKDEIHQVCRVFLTFANDIYIENSKKGKRSSGKTLLERIIPHIKTTEAAIRALQTECVVTPPKKSKA